MARTIHWNSLKNSLQKYVKWSVLKRAQNQTDVFRKDNDGFYSQEVEIGILMRIVSFLMRMISTFEAFYEKDDKEG